MWWQGDYNKEPVVKNCIDSIIKNKPDGYNVVIITENNYDKYIEIPKFIINKFKKGIISIQALSDIIRARLLATHGGIWLDSTVYAISSYDYLKDFEFWTVKKDPNKYVPKGKWAFYAVGGQNKKFFQKISFLLEQYWKNHNQIIDYFLPDYVVLFLYNNDDDFKNAVDNLQKNNQNCGNLAGFLDKPFDKENWQNLKENTTLFKLSRKVDINLLNKQGTYFDVIVRQNKGLE